MSDFTGVVKRVAFNSSAADSVVVIAAVAGKKIVVHALAITGPVFVVTFQSNEDGTTLYINVDCRNGGTCLTFCDYGWFETVSGEGLWMLLPGAIQTAGIVIYSEV